MKFFILAAGRGERMGNLTRNCPKCMVKWKSKELINYIIDTAEYFNFREIVVVGGYKADILRKHLATLNKKNIKFAVNENFASTNMTATLFVVSSEMSGDIVISYSDIIYSKNILEKLIQSPCDIGVAVDTAWLDLWKKRMTNPLDDAETMKIDHNGYITEIGKKPNSIDEIQGQYIGLIKISALCIPKIKRFYYSLDKTVLYDGKPFSQMYMTSFLQQIIDNLMPVKAVRISGGWLEFDNPNDLCLEPIREQI